MNRKKLVGRRALNKRVQVEVRRELARSINRETNNPSVIENLTCNGSAQTRPDSPLFEPEDEPNHELVEDTEKEYRFSSSSDSAPEDCDDLESDIRSWTIENNVSHTQLTSLLKILRKYEPHTHLPKDSRTLMKTPRTKDTSICAPGEYAHFGFPEDMNYLVKLCKVQTVGDIMFQINIDGIPLTKSSSTQFWPILAYPSNSNTSPLTIGIYCGTKKPDNCNDYLKPFVDEVCERNIRIQLFSCDTPARSYICGIKGHNSFSGCAKCKQFGKTIERRVVFSTKRGTLRTDVDFRENSDEDHHNNFTVLTEIPNLDMVNDFLYEYMHLVCLGVVKKLILLWLRGDHRIFKLSTTQVNELSQNLNSLVPYICSEFSRKPRSFREIDRWKATEYRQFLLYTGPMVVKSVLPENHYQLFLCLSVSISILVNPSKYLELNNYAESLIQYFVNTFPQLYGRHHVSYNVHGLLHLASDSKRFGPLDSFSAFRFENHLGKLKRMVRSSSNQLAQIQRRIHERQQFYINLRTDEPVATNLKAIHRKGPLLPGITDPQYRKLVINNYVIKCNSVNDGFCVLECGKLVKVENIAFSTLLKSIAIIAFEYGVGDPLYQFPCDSRLIGIFVTKNECSELQIYNLSQIKYKCQVFPIENNSKLAVFPLIHTEI